MDTQYFKHYSPALGRDMEYMVYGRAGRPVLYIPCQDGRFFDFGDFHMAETLAPWIESGQIIVFSVDTIDKETWSDKGGEPYWRARRHELWMDYLIKEMVPLIQERTEQSGIISFGCSLGATHAPFWYLGLWATRSSPSGGASSPQRHSTANSSSSFSLTIRS